MVLRTRNAQIVCRLVCSQTQEYGSCGGLWPLPSRKIQKSKNITKQQNPTKCVNEQCVSLGMAVRELGEKCVKRRP